MSTNSLITEAHTYLDGAFAAVEEKGGVVPEVKNLANLEAAVDSIKPIEWGILYTTDYPDGKEIVESDLEALSIDVGGNTSITMSFGIIYRNTITGFKFGNKVTTIPSYFLNRAINLTFLPEIPVNVTTIGTAFLFDCRNFTGPINIKTLSTPSVSSLTLATESASAAIYSTGVTLTGEGASIWRETFGNHSKSYYRKLILG